MHNLYRWLAFMFISSMGIGVMMRCATPKQMPETQAVPLMFSLQETACLGDCPVYELKIFQDRTMQFTGSANTLVDSAYDTLDISSYQSLTRELHHIQGIEPGRERTQILDAAVIRIRYSIDDTLYTQSFQGEEPLPFTHLKQKIKTLAMEREWIATIPKLTSEVVTKELIIELKHPDDYLDLVHKYQTHALTYLKRLSPSQPYHLFEIEVEAGWEDELLIALSEDPRIEKVQWNRKMQRRER